jgi:predicted heme/steroid binding protein
VVADQIWIWRADHGADAAWTTNPTRNGLIVNGDGVTIYGLFNEHHEEYQTLWNGNDGRVYMYQSEMPYDVPDQASWMSGKTNGFASYKVAGSVTRHEAWGVGVYSFFRDAAVKAHSAIDAPAAPGVKFHNLTTVWLTGNAGSEITHIINDLGGRVHANSPADAMRQTLVEFGGANSGSRDKK